VDLSILFFDLKLKLPFYKGMRNSGTETVAKFEDLDEPDTPVEDPVEEPESVLTSSP